MRLADFILANAEPILAEWESFARGVWPGAAPDPATLRDHAGELLLATVKDMVSDQTAAQQSAKSRGEGEDSAASEGVDLASRKHGSDRADSGYELPVLIAEFRALRASVLRLWCESVPTSDVDDLNDLTRFNESIDQSLAQSVESFNKRVQKDRGRLVEEQAARIGAEAANRAKDIFLATLSHEMRTPLNAILGWASILSGDDCTPEDVREGVKVIRRNAIAQTKLMDDVLDISRIVSGQLHLKIAPCDLRSAIHAALNVARPAADAKGIALHTEIDPSASVACCDCDRMQQVIWNLLTNAIKFTPQGGHVSIKLSRDGQGTRIAVKDDGQGIAPQFLPHVFERFTQADGSTRRRFTGLGLGLSIVKHIVELHGGTVQAESAGAGLGSTFTVQLPVPAVNDSDDGKEDDCEPEGSGAADGTPDALTPGAKAIRLDGLRILVVDDEADARRVIARVLENAGATVILAADAPQAIEALKAGPPHILLSDIGMPEMDGLDLIRAVRSQGHTPRDLPAAALTAFAQKEDQRRALLAGYQVHIPKPVDPEDLLTVVASLAGRTGTS